MVYYNKLKGIMAERGVTQADLAKVLGITPQAVSKKLVGQTEMTINEAEKIVVFLEIKNPGHIFFGH